MREREREIIERDIVCVYEFCFAFIQRRLRICNSPSVCAPTSDDLLDYRALALFLSIILSGDNDCCEDCWALSARCAMSWTFCRSQCGVSSQRNDDVAL